MKYHISREMAEAIVVSRPSLCTCVYTQYAAVGLRSKFKQARPFRQTKGMLDLLWAETSLDEVFVESNFQRTSTLRFFAFNL